MILPPFPETTAVRGLCLRLLEDWLVAPYLADALEESDYGDREVLDQLRHGEEPDWYWGGWALVSRMLTIPPPLDDGSWNNVFAYAGEPHRGQCDGGANLRRADPRDESTPLTAFSRWDVAEVLGLSEGENDGKNWLVYGRLNDGRYFFLSAGCDYTGWG